jgi:hypothetical protein
LTCVACRVGRQWECEYLGKCSDTNNHLPIIDVSSIPDDEEFGPVREINTYKSDNALRDQQSTGRKRAAAMYPLDRDANCEWQMQKNCGGGKSPIVGCLEGKQEARHHGPDKNTLNNETGNVHRICHVCHNRWHARNDEGYVWGAVYNNHSPTVATEEEITFDQINWVGVKLQNVTD